MKSFRRHAATVNAGSMADIAFLLLMFFLVSTTISADKGILRKLPGECPSNEDCTKNRHERNILRIHLNYDQEIMIEDDVVEISDIRNRVKAFADNNGASYCSYCKGIKSSQFSDHPKDAVISLGFDTKTKYELFITVQDEITKAYYDLRAAYAERTFNKSPEELTHNELELVKKAYPLVISEVMVKNFN
ncbi:ExbD/TolR family protein [Winogradskyella aurantia]|uniref:Biopolymer transporter ExbD n=1 Tax=Winogradskyella aurantia TaxID=1915063 RepID=A0A265UT03_9FLAO|nr:biopolymer transporter ExbD [Winogradskyella aurantia]OZV68445.1 biopolymer transporter ExbD [Winogradskyella aurantia]